MSELRLTRTEFQKTTNTSAHRTSAYEHDNLVVRRGQPWSVSLTFSRQLQSADALKIICETGPSPSVQRNTRVEMPVSSSGSRTAWSAVRGQGVGTVYPITINTPASAVIGKYSMSLEISSGGRSSTSKMGDVMLLFNAWVSADEVYMSSEAEKGEYILNESGQYWAGNINSFGSGRWDYGQFDYEILDITLTMLDRNPNYRSDAALDVSRRNDPIYVSRVLSAMVNSNDDNGMLVGNWSGNYEGGVSPSRWNGSPTIYRQWIRSGPVKYGQCWVYAGLLCTALRCLGIPARLIINFESAHDTDANLAVDYYYNADGTKDNYMTNDSLWNFHAWAEAWMARNDIGTTYNGWQIVDATPQEPSQGSFRLGPCSQKAVLYGDVHLDYDAIFVFGEVSADRVTWVKTSSGTYRRAYTYTDRVGYLISTKAVGSFQRRDITHEYKYREGSAEERQAYAKAKENLRRSASRMMLSSRTAEAEAAAPPVKPEFTGIFKKVDKIQVGDPQPVTLELKNSVDKPQKIEVKISASSIIYTGAHVKDILTETHNVTLEPNAENTIPITISYEKYRQAITADNMIKLVAVCKDERGGSLLVDTVCVLVNPPLLMRVIGEAKLKHRSTVDVIFTNPLRENVENCDLIVEGSGIFRNPLTATVPLLKPNQRVTIQFDIDPYKLGERSLLADFSSAKFPNVKGYQSVMVGKGTKA